MSRFRDECTRAVRREVAKALDPAALAELFSFRPFGDIEHDVADTDDLAVDAQRVVAGETATGLRRVRGARCAQIHVGDRFARECASVAAPELWPEVGHELGDGDAIQHAAAQLFAAGRVAAGPMRDDLLTGGPS